MREFDDKIPVIVQTHRGNIPIEQIVPTDIVYDFINSEELEVQGIINNDLEDVYRVEYSDRRIDFYRHPELIYIGDRILTVEQFIKNWELDMKDDPIKFHNTIRGNIPTNPIRYNINKVVNPLFPDPYITGALLIHGHFEHEWANLPLDRYAANPLMAHKYQLNFAYLTRPNTVFFRFNGTPIDSIITWKEFFPNYSINFSNENFVIPEEYMRASENDRWQFIQGVFDVGYNKRFFPESCSAAATHESRLKEVQKMLWSLGVLSTVRYDPDLIGARGRQYRIDAHVPMSKYPRFFYDIGYMSRHLINEQRIQVNHPLLKLGIRNIRKFARATSPTLALSKPRRPYVTGNFLPRISL